MKIIQLFILIVQIFFFSCKGNLEIIENMSYENPGYPDYTFNFRVYKTNGDSTNILIENDTINRIEKNFIELYINQLEFQKSTAKYKISYNLPENADASIFYSETEYRPGDLIDLMYSNLEDKTILFQFRPITTGNLQMNLSCIDESGRIKKYNKKLYIK